MALGNQLSQSAVGRNDNVLRHGIAAVICHPSLAEHGRTQRLFHFPYCRFSLLILLADNIYHTVCQSVNSVALFCQSCKEAALKIDVVNVCLLHNIFIFVVVLSAASY